MFGHQQDITAQDRTTDVTVQLPDDAIAALTGQADAAVQPTNDAAAAVDLSKPPEEIHPSVTARAIDGLSTVPQQNAALPSSYLEFLGAPDGQIPAPLPEPTSAPEAPEFTYDAPTPQIAEPVVPGPYTEPTFEQPVQEVAVNAEPEATAEPASLEQLKQAALQQLVPLVNQLEQTPQEKFRTLLMLIQASDDQSLISQAYETAGAITDEKLRAQALLDVVNEINYFTNQTKATPVSL